MLSQARSDRTGYRERTKRQPAEPQNTANPRKTPATTLGA